jgi:hypothetical protein
MLHVAVHPLLHLEPQLAGPGHSIWIHVHPHFQPHEFRFPFEMDAHFLRWLHQVRLAAGVPFRFRSDHRPTDHNTTAGGAVGSAHIPIPCRAVDLAVLNNYERYQVIAAAILLGCTRIGIYPARPDNSGSIHLDCSTTHPQPRIWTRF